MSLTLTTQPGFVEVLDSVFNAGNAASDSAFKSLNDDAKFAAVRNEQFYGFYSNAESVVLPVSPADGYAYSRSELLYSWSIYSSSAPGSFPAGTMTPPVTQPPSGQGTLLGVGALVDPASGLVTCIVSYFKTSQQVTSDGILFVVTHAQRSR